MSDFIPGISLPRPAESVILVVDDVAKNVQLVGTILRQAGYQIMPATSGMQALQRLKTQLPDLILLDLMMPEMDGIEVCRLLQAEGQWQQIPVVFLSAADDTAQVVKALEEGAVDYLTKPFQEKELLARVKVHLDLKHTRDALLNFSRRLQQMNEEKDNFLGMAAHDLKSPLTTVKGFLELLLAFPQITREEQEKHLNQCLSECNRMINLIRRLLDCNQIERGQFQVKWQECDLTHLLDSTLDAYRGKAQAKGQTLFGEMFGTAVPVTTDPEIILQIVDNLVSNALKFSPADKTISMRLRFTLTHVRLEVQDEGPGLSTQDKARLFGQFSKLSARPTGGENSTGLGLSIVKTLVETIHGRIWCESEQGHGACFLVELPISASTEGGPQKIRAA